MEEGYYPGSFAGIVSTKEEEMGSPSNPSVRGRAILLFVGVGTDSKRVGQGK